MEELQKNSNHDTQTQLSGRSFPRDAQPKVRTSLAWGTYPGTVGWARYLPRAPSSASALKTVLALLDLTRSKSTPPSVSVSVARLRLGGSPPQSLLRKTRRLSCKIWEHRKNAPITMDDFTCSNMGQLLPNENSPNRFGVRAPLADTSPLFVPERSCPVVRKTGLPHGGFWNVNGRRAVLRAGVGA